MQSPYIPELKNTIKKPAILNNHGTYSGGSLGLVKKVLEAQTEERNGVMRELHGYKNILLGAWLVVLVVFQLYTAAFGIFPPYTQRGIHLLFLLPVTFLLFPATRKSPKDDFTMVDAGLAILSLIPTLYIILNNSALLLRVQFVDDVSKLETVLGVLMVVLLIEGVRRAVVPAMAYLIIGFCAYLFLAQYLPGVFYSPPPSLPEFIEMEYLFTDNGIFGSITGVSATFVSIFVIFGAFMEKTNTGRFFTDIACRLAGKGPGGPAKIAVISSGLFGSISGVAAANVYSTGIFTIPLMKHLGYRSRFAAAVEASASTGGMLMPPIMGAGAFVMAEITRISYLNIIIAAMLGAVLYYISLVLRVHFTALKEDLKGVSKESLVPYKEILKDSYLLLPMVVLVVILVKGFSPFLAANLAIACSFLLSFFKKETRMTPVRLFDTLRLSGNNMVMIALACAGAGMVVSIVTNTGLGLGLATVVTNWSGGHSLPALLLVMLTSLILGMGLPCTPAYVIAITVGGPILLAMNYQLLSVHLFVFYFAILAGVTPPVCIPAFCAASIASSKPLQTGFEAFRLSIVGFLIPYVFIHNHALMMKGSIVEILMVTAMLIIAIVLFAGALSGYLFIKLNGLLRMLTLLIAFALTYVSASPDIINSMPSILMTVTGIIILVLTLYKKRRDIVVKTIEDPHE